MRSLKLRILGAAAVAALAGAAIAAEPILSADVGGKAIEADTAHLSKLVELAGKKKVGGRPKATAVLVALYAEDNLGGKDAAKMATLRDEALKIAEKSKTIGTLGAEVKALSAVTANPKADVKPMGAQKIIEKTKLDLTEVMDLFGGATAGGMNLEKDIREMKKDGVKNTPAAELLGARSAVLAELTMHLPNDKAGGANKKVWDGYSMDMKKLSQEIATEAAKGSKANLATIKTTVGKLDAACTNCHNKFRAD
ncbi:cytochrome c [Limnoglobus roseus]|uniref:Cytochrome c n=1 Tax=Limnoglobus roseus TaxID=2598579 RepID=A0A5C1A227_9BACT|nr:cytochrome c [Limnoglobus roseus]QEL13169.1 hypothetical protein PX52LOC_00022 [Limnoglobus roseus]